MKFRDLLEKWRGVKAQQGFHDFVLFLVFVGIATLFWFVMSLNDSVTETFDVNLQIENVPDSVTFINDPPASFHLTMRDKGTNLLRSGVFSHPKIGINFRDYSSKGEFRVTHSELTNLLKTLFGSTSQITACSLDSLLLYYTTEKGKRVPVVVCADLTAAPGSVISGAPESMERAVLIYSKGDEADTVTRVYTERIVKRNLQETTDVEVRLRPIASTKIVPSSVKVRIPVEPLVKKESMATVKAVNVPAGESLLLFPNRVQITYYVPMSLFSSDLVPVDVVVDYAERGSAKGGRLPVRIGSFAEYVENPVIHADSVEYTLVRE